MKDSLAEKTALFEHAPVGKAVWQLAIPTMISMLVVVIYNMADTYFIGQTGDALQVAAVSLALPIFMIPRAVGNLFGVGGSSCISRALGSGDHDRVKHISSFCFYGSLVAGGLLGLFFLFFMPQVVHMIGASAETTAYVCEYLKYIAIGGPFMVMSNAFSAIVRSEGGAKQAMCGMLIGTVTNILLDPIMILGLDMGVTGAAVATVIGNVFSAIYYLFCLRRPNTMLSIRPQDFMMTHGIAVAVLSIGIPGSITNLLTSVSQMVYNAALSGYGDAPIAAMGVAIKCSMMIGMVVMGFSMGAQPLIGYAYGAQNADRLKKVVRYTLTCGFLMGLTLAIAFLLCSPYIVGMFIDDLEVITLGTKMLRIQAAVSPFLSILFVTIFSMQAMGKAVLSMILSICRQGLLFIPAIYISNLLFGLDGLVWAQSVADMTSVAIALLMLVHVLRHLPQKEQETAEDAVQPAF